MNRVFGTSPNFPVVIPGESWGGLPLDRAALGLQSRRRVLRLVAPRTGTVVLIGGPAPVCAVDEVASPTIRRVAAEPIGLQGRLLCFQRQQSRQRRRNRRLCFRPSIRAAWGHSTLGCRPIHPRSDGTFCQALMALSGLRLSQSRPGTRNETAKLVRGAQLSHDLSGSALV